jgi:SAM-dependent methyltransferase
MVIQKRGDYDDYVVQQGKKGNNPGKRKWLISDKSRAKRKRRFVQILDSAKSDLLPGKILCLGARTGCEVAAARGVGFPGSQGIDLHPIGSKHLVKKGDWHDIPFDDDSFENAFTNSIDHCYDVGKLATEVHRILKPGGRFYFMMSERQMLKDKPDQKTYMAGSQNFLFWENGHDLAMEFTKHGFRIFKEWAGRKWASCIVEKVV